MSILNFTVTPGIFGKTPSAFNVSQLLIELVICSRPMSLAVVRPSRDRVPLGTTWKIAVSFGFVVLVGVVITSALKEHAMVIGFCVP